MRRSQGLKKVLLIACAMAVAVAFVLPAGDAFSACNCSGMSKYTFTTGLPAGGGPIGTKIALIKPGTLYKIVSKPTTTYPLPPDSTVPGNPGAAGGSVTVTANGGTLTCDLAAGNWKGLGNPAGSKGWKYVNTAAPSGDACKLVLIKAAVIKVLAKATGTLTVVDEPGNTDVSLQLVAGSSTYCALAPAPHFKGTAGKLLKMKDKPAPASCPGPGTLSNYRCSNEDNGACADDADCDFGTCFDPPGVCSGDLTVMCSGNGTPCTGTCGEVAAGNLPMSLESAALYTGGGLNSVPLPLPVPDRGKSVFTLAAGALGPTTPGAVGDRHCTKGRTCSTGGAPCIVDLDCGANGPCLDNCLYGAPLPIPNPGTPATSVCAVNVVGEDAGGTLACDGGDLDADLPLRSVIYLNGDLFKASTPPDIPGVQPCPLCQGGDPDVLLSGTCLGGTNNGGACTPETSDSAALGDIQNAYPTSHDCPNDPLKDITTNIGGLPIELALTTGSQTLNAEDRPNGRRNFCGFCRDVTGGGSLCFEGSLVGGCPASIPAATGNAVPCNSDADCADADTYESCVQRNPGAFSEAAATRIEVNGSTDDACMDDAAAHAQTQVSIFCIPPTFDSTVDAAGDLPGPGATLLRGDGQVSP